MNVTINRSESNWFNVTHVCYWKEVSVETKVFCLRTKYSKGTFSYSFQEERDQFEGLNVVEVWEK